MQGDINKFVSQLIHEINLRLENNPNNDTDKSYNLGLEVSKIEAKKLLKVWKSPKQM